MSEERITIEGKEYVSPRACSFGDYGGSGSVGLANIRSIIESAKDSEEGEIFQTGFSAVHRAAEEKQSHYALDDEIELRAAVKNNPPLVLHVTGDWSSETVYIRADSELAKETLESIEEYPVLNEDLMTEIESEWEQEAWNSWVRSDLERAAWKGMEEPEDESAALAYAAMDDKEKQTACWQAMSDRNEYFESELSGSYARVENFADRYREIIESKIADSK